MRRVRAQPPAAGRPPWWGGLHALFLLPVLLLPGCRERSPDRAAQEDRIRAQIRQEVRAELLAELGRAPAGKDRGLLCPCPCPAPGSDPAAPSPTVAGDSPGPATRSASTLPLEATRVGRTLPVDDPAPPEQEDLPDPALPPPARELPAVLVEEPEPRVLLVEATMARDVREQAPVAPGNRFSVAGEPLYAFAVFDNREGPTSHVLFVWRYQGQALARSRVRVGRSSAWHTWAYHTIPAQQSGAWSVEIQSEAGLVLRILHFVVSPRQEGEDDPG